MATWVGLGFSARVERETRARERPTRVVLRSAPCG